MPLPERQTSRLRSGRISLPGARYFLTLCTQHRAPVLTSPPNCATLVTALQSLSDDDTVLLAATLMPDHVHLLFTLGTRLTCGQVMGKFKTLARDRGLVAWRWQENGFEHRLRPDEFVEDYGFYIFMNPYGAGLQPVAQSWPWWVCPNPAQFRFLSHVVTGCPPPPAWLGEVETVANRIATGEP